MFLLNYIKSFFTKVSLCLQINGKQNATFQFSVKVFSNKMHEVTFKLILTQRQYVDSSYWVVAINHRRILGNFLNAEKHFYKVKAALSEWVIELILNFAAITLRFNLNLNVNFKFYQNRHYLP